jgi:hypothetical protein
MAHWVRSYEPVSMFEIQLPLDLGKARGKRAKVT